MRALPEPVFVVDPAGGWVEAFVGEGEHPERARNRRALEEVFPEHGMRARLLAAAAQTIASGQRQCVEYELSGPEGQRAFEGHTVLFCREPSARVLWMAQNVTEHRTVATRLREREALLSTLIESLPFDLWLLGRDGRYSLTNSTARQRWGDAIGKRPADMQIAPEVLKTWEANNARAMAGEVVRGEVAYPVGGEERHYFNILAPIRDSEQIWGIVGLNLDITEEKRLALELERHRRLESVGALAGGIAHDFNNYLTVILSGISLLQTSLESMSDQSATLADMEGAALRARALTRQLLTFARGGAPLRTPVEIGELVAEAATLATAGSSCRCELIVQPGLPPVSGDADQLRQVIHNLVLNAVQAMPGGGTVQVEVKLLGDRQIEIAVHDRGVGIPKELAERVLDPFFTTKAQGHGLGLALSYSIVTKHGGTLVIDSKPGEGTSVFVRLPCCEAEPRPASDPVPAHVRARPAPARLLVMDDDARVGAATARLLEQLGHSVQVASGCQEMLALVRSAATPYDAILFDLVIPGGPPAEESLQLLRTLDRKVPLIAYSAYAHSPLMAEHQRYGFATALPKPFTLAELGAALETVLGHGRS